MNAYANVTQLKSGTYLDITGTTDDAHFRNLLEAASRFIDAHTGRFFYCDETTRYYDGAGTVLWTDDILSVTTLKTDDDDDKTYENSFTEDTDYYLYPLNDIVKTRAEIRNQGSYGSFAGGIKKGIEIAGVFGYGDGESTTPYIDSNDDVANTTKISAGGTTLDVTDGTKFAIGQTIRMETEQCYISAISSNALTIERGVNGTTDADHLLGVDIYIYRYPKPIKEACLIQTMRWWTRKDSAFADVIGVPELGTVIAKKGLDPDVQNLLRPYKRYA